MLGQFPLPRGYFLTQFAGMPGWFDDEQKIHRTQWTLLERDDGGPVEFDEVVK